MAATGERFDPYLHDPAKWGVSLAHVAPLLLRCLDAAGVRAVAEVGAYAGDLTRVLTDWAAHADARVIAIDPAPQPDLVALADACPQLELRRQTSLQALGEIELPDAIVIDGDHNHYTVSQELARIAERAGDGALPLLFLHDVCWPHARRDDYFDPEQIPAERRHPLVGETGGIAPGDPGVSERGLPYPRSAASEGGPGNGVLTAVEDFVATREDVRLAIVPAFFGLGVAWDRRAPWSERVAALVGPYDRNPLLAALEANRVQQLAAGHGHLTELWELRERCGRQEAILRRLLQSSAFSVAERLSRLRARARIAPGQSIVAKDEIRRALER